MTLPERLRAIAASHPTMAATCLEAAAIIEKLPVTEDGVTILPGMELWHIERGCKFANGSQAYTTYRVEWLGWHPDRRKRQRMYFAVGEDTNCYYDGKDWFTTEYAMLLAVGDQHAIDEYRLEQSVREAAKKARGE